MEPKQYPVNLNIDYPERSSRLLALLTLLLFFPKALLLLPHIVVVYLLGYFMILIGIFAQIVVLITGKYPKSIFSLMLGIQQWQVRLGSYFFGLTDKYPPFSFK